jgi:3-oxoacyl-[acyl-carrier protein] reductase
MKKIEGKTAMITGCNRGIGRAIMETFMVEGANIVACTRKLTPELETYYQQSEEKYSVNIRPLVFDLADENSIKAAMKELYSWKIAVDILVNNAGVASGGFLLFTKMDNLKSIFQINYFSQVLITQYVVKLMMRNHCGSIIFMSSVLGLDSRAGGTAYGASKAAIAEFAKSLSKEVGPSKIRVNAIAPNLVDTEMAHLMEEKSFSEMVNTSALKRLASPQEIAKVALFLASDDSSYITGQVIRVDGGM